MAEEVGIVMKLHDQVSPTLKAIAGNTKAFDKHLDDLAESVRTYEKAQESMTKRSADLKKALAETDVKVKDAQKSYKKLKDETSKGALDAAIDEQTRLRQELKETEAAIQSNSAAYRELSRQAVSSAREASAADNRASRSGGGSGVLSALGKAGLGQMASDTVMQAADAMIGSMFGQEMGTLVSSGLSGAVSGAAMGSLAGPVGMAIGAAAGGLMGTISGAAQNYASQDEAFKAYYGGLYDEARTRAAESLESGSTLAGQRELDALAFEQLLGKGVGTAYLEDLRDMAAKTPMEYGDLTSMSRALATGFGDSPERMLELMSAIGDAGSAVGVTAADMTEMARAMSRMNASGKATLEFLNIFQDRGVDVIGMLGEAMGKTQGEIYSMISKGEINGQYAADVIQRGMEAAYGGAMDSMAETFSGLTSTLADTMAELDAARGTGYNNIRSGGMEAEISAYGGVLGDAVARLNEIAGENEAYMENLRERYTREALSAVLLGEDTSYIFGDTQKAQLESMRGEFIDASAAYASGSQEAGLKMDDLREQAEILAKEAYESSDQYQIMHDAELDQIEALRNNTSALEGWKNEYELSMARGIGRAGVTYTGALGTGIAGIPEDRAAEIRRRTGIDIHDPSTYSNAYGLSYVPYDGYAAILHQGERVLTAREAREADRSGSSPVVVNVGGSWTVRQDSDVDAIAAAIYKRFLLAREGGVR